MRSSLPLLAAVAPALVCGLVDNEQASTVTVVQTFTKTHASVIYVTQPTSSSGPSNSATCAATGCPEGVGPSASSILSTIHATSYGTNTVTAVVTSDGSTVTLLEAASSNTSPESSVSCTKESANSTSPSVAGTLTRSVYPTPANDISLTSGPIGGFSTSCNTSLPYHPPPPTVSSSQPPYPCNKSTTVVITTVTASTAEVNSPPVYSNSSATVVMGSTSATYSASTSYRPANYTGSPFPSSASRAIEPPSLLGLIARVLSLSNTVLAVVGTSGTGNGNTAVAASPLEGRFYPYPDPLNSGPPPHLTVTPQVERDLHLTANDLSTIEPPASTPSILSPPGGPIAETSGVASSFTHAPDTFTPSWSTVLNIAVTESVAVLTTVSGTVNQPRSNESTMEATTVYTTVPSSINVTETLAVTTTSTYTTDSVTTETVSTPPFSGPAMTASATAIANGVAPNFVGLPSTGATKLADIFGVLFMFRIWFG